MAKEYIYYETLSDLQKKQVNIFNKDLNINYESVLCEICNSNNLKILFNNDKYGINQKTCCCKKCGFVFSNPRMSKKSANDFYNSDFYRLIYSDGDNYTTEDELYKETLKNVKQHQPSFPKKPNFEKYYNQLYFDFINNEITDYETVLDIGTGEGKKLIDFKFIGKKTEGIEPSKTFNKVHLELGLNSRIGFLDNVNKQYDLVTMSHVFEHLTDLDDVVKKLSNITKKYLFIEVPGQVKKLQSIQNAHNYYFSLNTLNHFILKNKFKLVKIDYARDNEFILALYEKSENNLNYNFHYDLENKIIKKIYTIYSIKFYFHKFFEITKTKKIVNYLYNKIKKIVLLT